MNMILPITQKAMCACTRLVPRVDSYDWINHHQFNTQIKCVEKKMKSSNSGTLGAWNFIAAEGGVSASRGERSNSISI